MVEKLQAVVALAWKWHDESVALGYACSEPAQELFELLGWPDRAAQLADSTAPGAPDTQVLQFLTDVTTAAGLLSFGKTDKKLASRISGDAYRLRNLVFNKAPQGDLLGTWNAALEEAAKLFDQSYMEYFGSNIQESIRTLKSVAPTAQQSLTAGGAAELEGWRGLSKRLIAIVEELEAQISAAPLPQVQPSEALDGVRYRWLVDYANSPAGAKVWPVQDWVRGWNVSKPDLDAAIDAAIVDQQPVTPSGALNSTQGEK